MKNNIVGHYAEAGPSTKDAAQPQVLTDKGIFRSDTSHPDTTTLSAKTEEFFHALWPNNSQSGHKIGICSWKPGFSNTWFDPTEAGIKDAAAQAIELGVDVYLHCALHDPAKTDKRGNNKSAGMLTALWADIDLAEAGKETAKNYPPRAFVEGKLEHLPVPPSCIIDSGNGIHAYWYLAESIDAHEHSRLPAAFQAYLRSQLVDKETGEAYDIDSTGDLARVMRVPGTKNSKAGRLVRIIELHPDRRYAVSDLARYCPAAASLTQGRGDHTLIDIVLNPDAELPSTKFEELLENPVFYRTWARQRPDLNDQSQSGYDMSLASDAIRAGWSPQETADLLVAHREKHGQDLKRLEYYQRTIATAHEGLENSVDEETKVIEELNQRHAIIHVDRTLILTEKYDPIFDRNFFVLEPKHSLFDWYVNRQLNDKNIAHIWFKHADRQQYEGLVFAPGSDIPGHYNLFRGFQVDPKEGDCSLYLALIKDVICNGNEEHSDYVIKWLAHLFQKPAELPGTALVLRGKQGTGKGTMMKYLGELVGQHYLELVQMGQLTGRFNAHMKDALLVHANEAIWGGNKESEGPIKAMITDETCAVEFKGRDIITVKNYKRLVLASNNDWVAPRDMDDRRFFVLDVSNTHKEDQEYFAAIREEMASGGTEALMYHLLNADLGDFNPRVMPDTNGAGFDMKLRSMDNVMQWLYEALDDGVMPPDESDPSSIDSAWPLIVPKATFHGDYLDWCSSMNQRHPLPLAQFAKKLNGVITNLGYSKPSRFGKRTNCFNLPPLAECRRDFEHACKEGPYIWSQVDTEN